MLLPGGQVLALHTSKSPLALVRSRGRQVGTQVPRQCPGLQQQRVKEAQRSPQATTSLHQEAVGEQGATYSQGQGSLPTSPEDPPYSPWVTLPAAPQANLGHLNFTQEGTEAQRSPASRIRLRACKWQQVEFELGLVPPPELFTGHSLPPEEQVLR